MEKTKKTSRKKRVFKILLLLLVVFLLGLFFVLTRWERGEPALHPLPKSLALAKEPISCTPGQKKKSKQIYWGDLHVHTSFSMDAYSLGTRNSPEDAYHFAKGKPIVLGDGTTQVQIGRKLDFAAVTDHAEFFDVSSICFDPKHRNDFFCIFFRNGSKAWTPLRLFVGALFGERNMFATKNPKPHVLCSFQGINCDQGNQNTWKATQIAANNAYEPCQFTSFVAYEWTATPQGSHIHRNVIFKNENVPDLAYDFVRYPTAKQLWKALNQGCTQKKGCDVIAIPHNTNWSNGLALKIEGSDNEELELRAKYEKLVEIHQSKGNSECLHPFGDDKGDCNFEISINQMSNALQKGNWYGLKAKKMTKERWKRIQQGYVRSALQRGLRHYQKAGKKKINPLQLGFVGSTDTHNATPGEVSSNNFKGHQGDLDRSDLKKLENTLDFNPGGLTGVWALENTRTSLFEALKRREVFATSGPRIRVRFWQTWDTTKDHCKRVVQEEITTTMGSTMPQAKPNQVPVFVVEALQDRTRLSRIDIYKTFFQAGKIQEKMVRSFAVDKQKGDASMCFQWLDKSFHWKAPALWYARVLEKPTPRWSQTLCKKQKNCHLFPKGNRSVTHRAWTSPIWFLP